MHLRHWQTLRLLCVAVTLMAAGSAQAAVAGDRAELEAIYRQLLAYRQDPIGFGVNVLGLNPEYIWAKMRDVCESVRDHQLTAVPAGHSVSKTYSAGRIIVPWFKTCFQPSTVITTAPSDNQVTNQLWREIRASHVSARVPLGGKLLTAMWDMKPSEAILKRLPSSERECWEKNFAIGFSTSPDTVTQYASKMQGWHNEWLLVVLDEACGIARQIWETVMMGLVIDQHCKVLAIGNPTDPESDFAEACRLNGKLDQLETSSEPYTSDQGFHVVPVSVLDTPNYQQGRTVIPSVAGVEFEEHVCKRHRKGSDGWLIRVRGAFPATREGTYYAQEYAQAMRAERIGDYPYDPSFAVYRFGDFGDTWTGCVDAQFIRDRIRIVNDYWDNAGVAASHGGGEPVDATGAQGVAKSMQAMPYVWGKEHYAGPDLEGSNRKDFAATATTRDVLRGLGFNFLAVPNHSFDDGIEAVRMVWPLLDIDARGAATFVKAIKGYGKKKNEQMSTPQEAAYHDQPAKTWHRHLADALRHLAVQYRFGTIGGKYIGDSRVAAAYHQGGNTSPYANWHRFNRGRRRA